MTDIILRTGILLLIAVLSTADSLAISPGTNRQSKATNLEEPLQPLAAPLAPSPQSAAQPSSALAREQSSIGEQSTSRPSSSSMAASIRRSSYDVLPVDESSAAASVLSGESDPHSQKTHSNIFFGNAALPKQAKSMLAPPQLGSATFENIAPNYIGPNYLMSGSGGGGSGPVNRNSHEDGSTMSAGDSLSGLTFPMGNSQQQQQGGNPLSSYYQNLFSNAAAHFPGNKVQQGSNKPSEDSINDVFNNAFKKYNVKKYLLQKILGTTHEMDEDDGGFFSNKHLKRHGTAGMAAKVIGELIGIKIRESIEGFGKSFSEYAKDFTARNFVNLGHVFSRMLKYQR